MNGERTLWKIKAMPPANGKAGNRIQIDFQWAKSAREAIYQSPLRGKPGLTRFGAFRPCPDTIWRAAKKGELKS